MTRTSIAAVTLVLLGIAAASASVGLASTFTQQNRYQHLVCVYAWGSQIRQCPITGTGPQIRVGFPCYCGNSPKGIIRSVPLTLAP